MHGARSWRKPSGCPLPVAASYLHAGNHFRKLGSTVKIDAAQDVYAHACSATRQGADHGSHRATCRTSEIEAPLRRAPRRRRPEDSYTRHGALNDEGIARPILVGEPAALKAASAFGRGVARIDSRRCRPRQAAHSTRMRRSTWRVARKPASGWRSGCFRSLCSTRRWR